MLEIQQPLLTKPGREIAISLVEIERDRALAALIRQSRRALTDSRLPYPTRLTGIDGTHDVHTGTPSTRDAGQTTVETEFGTGGSRGRGWVQRTSKREQPVGADSDGGGAAAEARAR